MYKKTKIVLWMLSDFIIVISGIYMSFLIRYLGIIPHFNFIPFTRIWYLFGVTSIASLYYFGLYNSEIEKNNKEIMLRYLKAIAFSTLIMMDIAYVMREKVMTFPSSVFFLGIVINALLCGLWRIFILYEAEEEKSK